MKVSILGGGSMGKTLGGLLSGQGYEVMLGTRRIEDLWPWAASKGQAIKIGSYEEASQWSSTLFLATAYLETKTVISNCGDLVNKVLVDCSNPEDPAHQYEHPRGKLRSWSEEIADLVPGAKVVKTLNHVYGSMLEKGTGFNHVQASGFLCGDDQASKDLVASILVQLGLQPIDVGPLVRARQLEPLAELLVHLASSEIYRGEDIAFKLLSR